MRKIEIVGYQILLIFSFLGVLFIPFSFRYFDFQANITKFLFADLILYVASNFEGVRIVNHEISSDSATLYLLLVILFVVSIILVAIGNQFNFIRKNRDFIFLAIQLVLTYYLSLIMLKYGFDKVFKAQFYLPEPNTLYTPLGLLDRDILYWSTMGTSYLYNIFMGFSEVLSAMLLLFRRTRVFGLIILTGILINITFINFGFDISVKLYSLFLLLLCFILLAPSFKAILRFFILNKAAKLPYRSSNILFKSEKKRAALKIIIILFFFGEALLPYIQKGNFNDDNSPRNYLHGAYKILKIEKANANQTFANLNIKRVFIHRHNYFIFQYEDDSMEDFYLEIDPNKKQFILTGYDGEKMILLYNYSVATKILELKFPDEVTIYSIALPWRELPLLQPLFHWTIDEIQ